MRQLTHSAIRSQAAILRSAVGLGVVKAALANTAYSERRCSDEAIPERNPSYQLCEGTDTTSHCEATIALPTRFDRMVGRFADQLTWARMLAVRPALIQLAD